jgi:hypothetical protein
MTCYKNEWNYDMMNHNNKISDSMNSVVKTFDAKIFSVTSRDDKVYDAVSSLKLASAEPTYVVM